MLGVVDAVTAPEKEPVVPVIAAGVFAPSIPSTLLVVKVVIVCDVAVPPTAPFIVGAVSVLFTNV